MTKKTKPERHLVLNRMQTPDGTILTSYGIHDYVMHTDKNGFTYSTDGGTHYLHRSVNEEAPAKDLSVYSDASYKVLRESIHRGGRGKDGTEPLKWVPISEMNNAWLEACIVYIMKNVALVRVMLVKCTRRNLNTVD